ncbi:ShlB/FhaC/HecB family hemolysin secretion/activation protein [Lampropedia cohaerens]|uniref:ShlB/FhaC/HecB family hemolysin secretion/activation protein n=1 Tax=Lampropedia cohaerens TaxID=1610491 RepID=UPI001E51762C|nr:ShlB/FhaC/HecB family hemolysin secretion/activation protein [Lampropedia cohaerens]
MLGAALASALQAQTPQGVDPALEFQRQQQRLEQLQREQQSAPHVRLQADGLQGSPLLVEHETPCFRIDQVILEGEMAEQFQWLLASKDRTADGQADPVAGRCLGSQGINQVMQRMQNALIAKGYVTSRIVAPAQDLQQGQLRLVFVPGRIRQVRMANPAQARAALFNALPVREGDVLNLRAIEQGLENFKRVPTADASFEIEAVADRVGYSDIVITHQQPWPFRVQLAVDDGGTKATGKYQGSVTVSYDNPLTLNDLLYLSFNHDLGGGQSGRRGSRGSSAYYAVPFGYWLLSVNYSQSRYHQSVAGATQDYIYSGTSNQTELQLARVLWRNASHKLSASIKAFQRRSRNAIDDTEVLVQRRATGGWAAGLDHRAYLGDKILDLQLSYRRGTGAFGALPAPEQAFGEGTSRFEIVTAGASLHAPFQLGGQRLRYGGQLRVQWADTPLAPQERFAIGGRYTVRGFDGESSLMAQRGVLLRNDIGWALGNSTQEAYLGVDHGRVSGKGAEWLLGRYLTGAVIGLRGGMGSLQYDLFVGKPLSKPDGFRTASTTAGFSVSYQF